MSAGEDFAQVTLPYRVFNRDFVTESVFPVGGGDVPPIFVLGKESVEKQKEVEQLKATRAEAQAKLESERSKQAGAPRALLTGSASTGPGHQGHAQVERLEPVQQLRQVRLPGRARRRWSAAGDDARPIAQRSGS